MRNDRRAGLSLDCRMEAFGERRVTRRTPDGAQSCSQGEDQKVQGKRCWWKMSKNILRLSHRGRGCPEGCGVSAGQRGFLQGGIRMEGLKGSLEATALDLGEAF